VRGKISLAQVQYMWEIITRQLYFLFFIAHVKLIGNAFYIQIFIFLINFSEMLPVFLIKKGFLRIRAD